MATSSLQDSDFAELQRRLVVLRVGLLLVVALLALRLWHLQIREGPYYRDLSENNRTRSVILEPARGLIFDRNGVLLANNVPSFSLYVSLEDVKDREALIEELSTLIGIDPELVRKKLAVRGAKQLPRKIKDRLTLKEATLIESHRLDLPGVMIQVESQPQLSWRDGRVARLGLCGRSFGGAVGKAGVCGAAPGQHRGAIRRREIFRPDRPGIGGPEKR